MAREADQEAMVVDTVVPKVVDTEVVSAAQVAVEAEVVVVSAAADVARSSETRPPPSAVSQQLLSHPSLSDWATSTAEGASGVAVMEA